MTRKLAVMITVAGTVTLGLTQVGGENTIAHHRDAHPGTASAAPLLPTSPSQAAARRTRVTAVQPLRFEENVGQFDARARYVARDHGATVFLTQDGAVLSMRSGSGVSGAVIALGVAGQHGPPHARGRLDARTHYLHGNDPAKWHLGVVSFTQVVYPTGWDGIDLVYHGDEGRLEYDFVVAPGAQPASIALELGGSEGLSITADGSLAIRTAQGEILQPAPSVYTIDGSRKEHVTGSYRLVDATHVGFEVASYDCTLPLVIDPVLAYSTYLGGNAMDYGFAVAADSEGNAYVAGETQSTSFPALDPAQANNAGEEDAYVAKFSPSGSLAYSTYLGGSNFDSAYAIAVDSAGDAYVTGTTSSTNFPTTTGMLTAGAYGTGAFVTELSPSGSLVYSTYLGGSGSGGTGEGTGIAVDSAGNAYVTGDIYAPIPLKNPLYPFPSSASPVQFVAEIGPPGPGFTLVYSTCLGSGLASVAYAIAVDSGGNAYVTGAAGRRRHLPSVERIAVVAGRQQLHRRLRDEDRAVRGVARVFDVPRGQRRGRRACHRGRCLGQCLRDGKHVLRGLPDGERARRNRV